MLDDLRNKIEALKSFDPEAELIKIVQSHTEDIADLQAEQLFTGRNRKGEIIYPEYAPATIEIKKQKGQPYDRVTYRDTGEMYRELKAFVSGDKFYIDSDNFKFVLMKKRSGERVVGLNESMRKRFAEDVTLPETARVFKEQTGWEITLR